MKEFEAEQEKFWAGDFGNKYTKRNAKTEKGSIQSDVYMFSKILSSTHSINSIMELGSNIGCNLEAIRYLLPYTEFSAVEINEEAVKCLNDKKYVKVYNQSIFNFKPKEKYDFIFTNGLLIHLNPNDLEKVYKLLYDATKKYICIIEYYNPTPVEIPYRGFSGKLFKRDFAGELLDKYKDVNLIDYGFVYHRDNNFPQDDMTWFLLEKTE